MNRAHPRRVEPHGHEAHLAEGARARPGLDHVGVHRTRHRERRELCRRLVRRSFSGGGSLGEGGQADLIRTGANLFPALRGHSASENEHEKRDGAELEDVCDVHSDTMTPLFGGPVKPFGGFGRL